MGEVTLSGTAMSMLSHMSLLGVAAVLEDAGVADVRLAWTRGMTRQPVVSAPTLDLDVAAGHLRAHAAAHGDGSWVEADQDVSGTRRGLMSPRIGALASAEAWAEHQRRRHLELDRLTAARAWLDLAMVGALGEPAYWSHNAQRQTLQDHGASRLEMQPRNSGADFVAARLRKLAGAVATREKTGVAEGLVGLRVRDEVGGDKVDSRTPTGFTAPGPTDNAVAWCALWGISQLPLAPRVNSAVLSSGFVGSGDDVEFLVLPVWRVPLRLSRVRTLLVSRQLVVAGSAGLGEPYERRSPEVLAATAWLRHRGVEGLARFCIANKSIGKAVERRASSAEAVAVA